MRKTKSKLWLVIAVTVVLSIFGLSACASTNKAANSGEGAANKAATSDSAVASVDRIVDPTHWQEKYPLEYNSYFDAGYLAKYTDGLYYSDYMFGKMWAWDAALKLGAHHELFYLQPGCIACHSSDFMDLADRFGSDLTAENITEEARYVTNGVTCYSCHGNDPGELFVSKDFYMDAIEKGGIKTDMGNIVCGQCHSLPDWSKLPTTSDLSTWMLVQVGLNADDVWAYLEAEGYTTPIVLATEIEFNSYVGSTMEQAGAVCGDCHMETLKTEDGTEYMNHAFQGANDNPAIYENCLSCHEGTAIDRQTAVANVQKAYNADLVTLNALLSQADTAIKAATGANVAEATALYNKACFYRDYGSDASYGVHIMGNKNVSYCWETATNLANQIITMLG